MNILLAVNKAYYPLLFVFLRSFCENNRSHNELSPHFYILHTELSDAEITRFTKYAARFGVIAEFRYIDSNIFAGHTCRCPEHYNFAIESFYRVIAPIMFDKLERILWLDVDSVVLGDLSELYQMDMQDKVIAATPNYKQESHKARLGIPDKYLYINSGLILYDIQAIISQFGKSCIFDELMRNKENYLLPDQDAISMLFLKSTLYLDSDLYNKQVISGACLSKCEYRDVLQHTRFLHYIKKIKPWECGYIGRQRLIYLRYLFLINPIKAVCIFICGLFNVKRKMEN